MNRRPLGLFKTLATGALLALVLSPAALAAPVELTILHTNDTHDHLTPTEAPGDAGLGGVARRSTLFQRIKREKPNVVILDAGDVFQGTAVFTFFAGEADFKAMRMLGYDAIAVGNHDLDNGLANLVKQARHLGAPPLSVNLTDTGKKLVFPGVRMLERGGLRIAVVGVIGKNAFEAIADDRRKDVRLLDPIATLRQVVPQVRRQADLVVVLSHSGHEEELAMAKAVPGIDLIVGGHSHTKVEKPVVVESQGRKTLVVQAFQWGEYVGRLDLVVDDKRITRFEGELTPVSKDLPEDPAVAAMVAGYTGQIASQMAEVVGRAAAPLPMARKSEGDIPLGSLIADALREAGQADVGIMNSGGIRAPLPEGPLTRGMIFSMLPFENRLVTMRFTGAQIQQILDFAASRLGKSGGLQISGASFVARGGKATEVTLGGAPLDPARRYRLATIDYLANGNDGAGVFKQAKEVHATGALVRDVFFAFLKAHPVLTPPATGRIRRADP